MEDIKLDEENAKKEIARSDNSHRTFIKRYFQAELEDPVNYDLVLNTEHLSFEAAASIVVGAVQYISDCLSNDVAKEVSIHG